jgi:DNA replication ATP-dependent helicase Dna2
VSLFRKLSEEHPAAMTVLEHQYRMNEDIMLLSNVLVYDGMLKCGNEAVAKQNLQIPDAAALAFAKPWVRDVLSERYKVVFCDTDLVPALETKRGDRTTNELEASFIKQVPPPPRCYQTELTVDCRLAS